MGIWLLSVALGAECADPSPLLDEATTAVLEGRYAEARQALGSTEATFSCGAPASEVLARFWLVEGALLVGEGDSESAALSLAAAHRTDASTFVDELGTKVRTLWASSASAEGHLMLLPAPQSDDGLLDGVPVEWPVTTPAGVHLIQVRTDGEVRFGRIVNVPEGQLVRVRTGLPEPGSPPPRQPAPVRAADPPDMLVLGAAALALGAGSLGMWAVSTGQLSKATTPMQAHRAQERRMAFGAGAVTLGAVGVVGIAGEFVF